MNLMILLLLFTLIEISKKYKLIGIEDFYYGFKIVFVIHFSIIYLQTFPYFQLCLIPTHNSVIIIPKNTLLVVNKNLYQYASLSLVDLHPDYYWPNNVLIAGLHKEKTVSSSFSTCKPPSRVASEFQQWSIIEQINESHFIAFFLRKE